MRSFRDDEKGIILIVAILALLVMAIFLPALVSVITNETKWAVKQKKTTTAFHMAEQGLDRGIWKVQESDAIYTLVSTNGVVPGYNFDVVYESTGTDAKDGEYKIKLTTGASTGRVLVQAMGRDRSTEEVRGIQVELTKNPIEAGLQVRSGLTYKSGTRVHWGPIVCYGDIDLPNAPDNPSAYPRKYAKGYVDERPPTGAGGPHGDTSEAWNGTYDHYCHAATLDQPPTIDLDAYRQLAMKSSIPDIGKDGSNATAASSPTGSGYFPTDAIKLVKPGGNTTSAANAYVFINSTSVIFCEASYSLGTRNKYSQVAVRAFIAPNATLSVNGDSSVPDRSIRIPDEAQKEYLMNSASYGNATLGWSAAQGNNTQAFSAVGEGNNFTVANVLMHGYLYFSNISNSGTDVVLAGVLDMAQATNPQSIIVYYDAAISTGILTMNQKSRQVYWREFKPVW